MLVSVLVARLSLTRRCIELRFVNYNERRLIEVATCVGVRIDEEALGAAFHMSGLMSARSKLERFLQYATGLFEDRTNLVLIFLRFFGSVLSGWCFADDFLVAVGVGALAGSGFGSSGFASSFVVAAAPFTSVVCGGTGSEVGVGLKFGVVIEALADGAADCTPR